MSKILIVAMFALAVVTTTANAQVGERTMTGAAIGAGSGAVIAGPPGAVVGGVVGAVVGGPRISHHRSCWRDDSGYRHCRWR
jgi:osmotically inducible lipoprotein OsmB